MSTITTSRQLIGKVVINQYRGLELLIQSIQNLLYWNALQSISLQCKIKLIIRVLMFCLCTSGLSTPTRAGT